MRANAVVVSEIFAPPLVLLVLLLEVGFREAGWAGAGFGFLAAIFVAIGPYCAVIVLSRRGVVSDRFVGDRKQRAPVLIGVVASIIVGLVVLVIVDAPRALAFTTLTIAVGLVLVTAVNLVWKLSIHASFAMFFAVFQVILWGSWGIVALVVPIGVGWSRVYLRAHTVAQVFAGCAAGLVIGVVYLLLE